MNQQEAIEAARKLGPEWKWVAMDPDGTWYAYVNEPVAGGDWWANGDMEELGTSTYNWTTTLAKVDSD